MRHIVNDSPLADSQDDIDIDEIESKNSSFLPPVHHSQDELHGPLAVDDSINDDETLDDETIVGNEFITNLLNCTEDDPMNETRLSTSPKHS